jgi:serine/threonine-protein kinase
LLEETGFRKPEDAIRAELVRLGLSPTEPPRRDSMRPTKIRARAPTVFALARGHVLSLVLIIAGAAAIQYSSRGRRETAPGGATHLALVPPRAGYLRVVADPWAHVIVDGEPVDTTPFAHAIPLTAGAHYVRFEHPSAPTERRTVTLQPDETVLLDVKMDIPRGNAPKPEVSLPSLSDPATP